MARSVSNSTRARTRAQRLKDAALRTIDQQFELSVRDSHAFVDALLNPKPVNDRLRETVRRYRETTGV